MALKFLNKKGWHTGSLRNIENVWKAEQKHDAEQKKLEELRKQIQEEREKSEFRLLQEQAGLVPRQERLEFLYDSGLAVGKSISSGSGFKSLESLPTKPDPASAPITSSSKPQEPSMPGALFEEKQQSSNDAWRKLHSDPLLLIRQREQEALARVKNNPVRMAMIHKSVEASKDKKRVKKGGDESPRREHHHEKKHEKRSSSKHHSVSENPDSKERRKSSSHRGSYNTLSSEDELSNGDLGKKSSIRKYFKHNERRSERQIESELISREKTEGRVHQCGKFDSSDNVRSRESRSRHRNSGKLTEEERAARLREMQMDAELHEEQRWKRLKKADENDFREADRAGMSKGRNFMDGVHKSAYGMDKGGSSTIGESIRRRTHYRQGGLGASEGNAFRR